MTHTHLTINHEHLFSIYYFVQSTLTEAMGHKYKTENNHQP